ncbi:MAG: hypothetical protein ABSH38_05355 [Verrucomicrobiota bacterium]|jgi:hypothetical protein
MSNSAKELKPKQSTDLVLQEIWRIKDTLSASYGHDVDRLFADARKRQKLSGHPVVNLQKRKTDRAKAKTA